MSYPVPAGHEPLTPALIGIHPSIARVRAVIERVAPTDISVLVTGETGTGKELVAHLVHARSLRSQAPFVVVDCPSMPATLFESELFGHERGGTSTLRPGAGLGLAAPAPSRGDR